MGSFLSHTNKRKHTRDSISHILTINLIRIGINPTLHTHTHTPETDDDQQRTNQCEINPEYIGKSQTGYTRIHTQTHTTHTYQNKLSAKLDNTVNRSFLLETILSQLHTHTHEHTHTH